MEVKIIHLKAEHKGALANMVMIQVDTLEIPTMGGIRDPKKKGSRKS